MAKQHDGRCQVCRIQQRRRFDAGLADDEIQQLLQTGNRTATFTRDRAMTAVVYRSGLRCFELLALMPKGPRCRPGNRKCAPRQGRCPDAKQLASNVMRPTARSRRGGSMKPLIDGNPMNTTARFWHRAVPGPE